MMIKWDLVELLVFGWKFGIFWVIENVYLIDVFIYFFVLVCFCMSVLSFIWECKF